MSTSMKLQLHKEDVVVVQGNEDKLKETFQSQIIFTGVDSVKITKQLIIYTYCYDYLEDCHNGVFNV